MKVTLAEPEKSTDRVAGRSINSETVEAANIEATPSLVVNPRPFRPHPKLFYLLSAMLLLWIIGLLVMYFTTVWPRHQQRVVPPPSAVREQA